MARQTINLGAAPNDGTGDSLRAGGAKIDANFGELYGLRAGVFSVKEYGALGDGATDDTTAIQDAIDACAAAGGGTVYFPAGVYVVNGALQDTGRSNAQLLLPIIMTDAVTEPLSIRLQGDTRPTAQPAVGGAAALAVDGSIIKSTLGAGTGAVIGGWGPVGSASDFSFCRVEVQNVTVRLPANPTNSGVDLSHMTACSLDGLVVDTSNYGLPTIAAQTTATSAGLKLPANNNGASVEIGRVDVIGFYTGVVVGEHTTAQHVAVWACKRGVVFEFAYHASRFDRLMTVHCQKGLVFTGGAHYFSIGEFNIEHAAAGTWVPTADIDDANNYGHGRLRWHVVLAGGGVSANFLTTGAANVQAAPLMDLTTPIRLVRAGEALTAGVFVNLYTDAGALKMRIAKNTDTTKPADGFVRAAVANGADGWFYGLGLVNDLLSTMTPGGTYYLNATGGLTAVVPATTGNGIQEMGRALSATELLTFDRPMVEAP